MDNSYELHTIRLLMGEIIYGRGLAQQNAIQARTASRNHHKQDWASSSADYNSNVASNQ